MVIEKQYEADIEEILSRRYENSAGLWTTPENRLVEGAPFSTLECGTYLLGLGMQPMEPLQEETAELIFSTWQEEER